MDEYITVQQLAEKWNVNIRTINYMIQNGKIRGARKFGTSWAIPIDTERPKDNRIKSGKYVKQEGKK